MDSPVRRESLLRIEDLKAYFALREGVLRAVDGITFEMRPGEIVGMVGESGCGKSVTALSILRLVRTPPARLSGRIEFKGNDLLKLGGREMRRIRGKQISMIFQDPMVSLNPVLRIGRQISEALTLHQGHSRSRARRRAVELLEMVGIPNPEKRCGQYIFQLSGGMRQRVMIAMALSCRPDILLADEPTTALDVTIQAQVLELIKDMNDRLGTAVLLITHDLGIVAGYTQRVMVVYAGKIVESASTRALFKRPSHPYTVGLMGAVPRLGDGFESDLANIPGAPPSLIGSGEGCAFWPRCFQSEARCSFETPGMIEVGPGHWVRCVSPLASRKPV